MKTFKQLITEVEQPRGDNKKFKDKHVVQKNEEPNAEEDQFVAKTKKDKSRPADQQPGKDVEVYEEVDAQAIFESFKIDPKVKPVWDKILKVSNSGKATDVSLSDGETVSIDKKAADAMLGVVLDTKLFDDIRGKFATTSVKDTKSFMKMLDYAARAKK